MPAGFVRSERAEKGLPSCLRRSGSIAAWCEAVAPSSSSRRRTSISFKVRAAARGVERDEAFEHLAGCVGGDHGSLAVMAGQAPPGLDGTPG